MTALPLVSWLPAVFTPGKSILELPLNDTPPIVLAVAKVAAVAALPSILPDIIFEKVVSLFTTNKSAESSPITASPFILILPVNVGFSKLAFKFKAVWW